MLFILFVDIKWIMVSGLILSFISSVIAIVFGIINLRFISGNDDIYRGESMSWISICLGVIAMLSTLPFVLAFLLSL